MKTFFTMLAGFLLISSSVFAQSLNKVEPQQFWETNIQAILNSDLDEVVSQSYFPMTTFEGDWSKKDFINSFDMLFDESILAALRDQSFRDIQAIESSPGEITYMVVIITYTEMEGETYESATILSFKKFDGEWKLYDIDMAG
ncbi:MAG: hypothetical protein HRT58_18995 [Crocinitomicaceae bacterium]|nr:hypothetical protein [Flavobacteriales bacterium]NQZ37758.1 hypothetical protein [Crocinitomicaceae bacterium]